jgi:hypothetical protein
MILKNGRIKCDFCGRFIPYKDLQNDEAYNIMITPYSDISFEEFESCCKPCNQKRKDYVQKHIL